MSKPIRVLIAEDHDVVREGLKLLISSDPGLIIAGEAKNGDDAVRVAKSVKPDVVVMDIAMPHGNGLEATRQIRASVQPTKVLVLSAYQDEDSVQAACKVGASGFITKHSAASELIEAVRRIHNGGQYYSPRLVRRMRHLMQAAGMRKISEHTCSLTPREIEVLALIAAGLSNKELASHLDLSTKTIEKHRQHIMEKLDIHEVAGLTRYAIDRGIFPIPGRPEQATQSGNLFIRA